MKTSLSKRQKTVLVIIASVHFFSSICISLQAPFYPREAELKGATATEYGLVFGCFELVAFIFSPVFGKIVHIAGAKLTLSVGMLTSSCSIILFGLLDFVDDHVTFISLSFVLRITESLGATAAVVSAFSLTGCIFPDSIATVFATLETFYGIGYIIGPTLGGILYDIGGFPLPFIFVGIVTAIVSLCILVFVPDIITEQSTNTNSAISDLCKILRVPSIMIDSACIVAIASSAGFYNATLEPHIREFRLKPVFVGLVFITSGGVYALVAPIFGRLVDRLIKPKSMMVVGCLFNITSFTIVGPAPLIPLPKTLTITIIALVIHGLSLAAINVSTFIDAIRSAIKEGYPDDLSTYGLISGIWTSSFALGAFIGPSVAGYLDDQVGFQKATLFVIITHFILFITLVIYINFRKTDVEQMRLILEDEITFAHLLEPHPAELNGSGVNNSKIQNGYGAVKIY